LLADFEDDAALREQVIGGKHVARVDYVGVGRRIDATSVLCWFDLMELLHEERRTT
jgi:hypothetical protein